MDNIKTILFSIIIILFFISCSSIKGNYNSVTKADLSIIITNWHKDAKNANFEDYFNRISNTGIYIGTDKTENWTKREFSSFAKPYFDKKKTWDFKAIKRNIYFSENKKVAWFDELLDTWMGICRGSGVLELENGIWKIKQYVLSVTIPNTEIEKVINIKKNVKDLE